MQDIGDRMKSSYETRHRHYLTRRTPVIVRLDGKAFHTFTRGMEKPFSQTLINRMVSAAYHTKRQMQGCKAAYIQSDEASFLLTDYDTHQTCGWFDYCQNKIESVSASIMTSEFNGLGGFAVNGKNANFDSRAFNIPRDEVANYFLWRMKDWERNSVAMLCQSHFSHTQLHGQGRADQHEMLHKIGVNWADLDDQLKNGTWIIGDDIITNIMPTYRDIANALDVHIDCDKQGLAEAVNNG